MKQWVTDKKEMINNRDFCLLQELNEGSERKMVLCTERVCENVSERGMRKFRRWVLLIQLGEAR